MCFSVFVIEFTQYTLLFVFLVQFFSIPLYIVICFFNFLVFAFDSIFLFMGDSRERACLQCIKLRLAIRVVSVCV